MPKFMVWSPDQGSTEADAREIEAFDASSAAEEWADRDDCESAEYQIVRGSNAKVCVRDGERVRTFDVSGETVALYAAREIGGQ
jgi:hypothetical protein